jgi:hypothetical protein
MAEPWLLGEGSINPHDCRRRIDICGVAGAAWLERYKKQLKPIKQELRPRLSNITLLIKCGLLRIHQSNETNRTPRKVMNYTDEN